uniref:Uncharacterized protein n=1 Tax=Panagrolaimus davidi TaxID=227884 RepID=A0A914QDY4_9BILA
MFDQPFDNHIIQKYYQAIRFDLRAEGLNMESREHESGTFKNCDFIDRTFIYGIFYNDKEKPGHEALLYYGLFI